MNYEFVEPNFPRWLSLEDIRKYFGMKDRMNIYGALRGKQKILKGFIWKYYEEVKDELEV